MQIGTILVSWKLDCRECGATVSGGTEKRVYVWFYLHMLIRHFRKVKRPLRTAWQLWKWKP